MYQAKRSGYRAVLGVAVDFLHAMYIKGKQMLVFNFCIRLIVDR